jgi:hypothetical protein
MILISGRRRVHLIELLSLSFLFGTAVISISTISLGFFLSDTGLRWALTVLCLAIGLIGLSRRVSLVDASGPSKWSRVDKGWLVVGAIQICLIAWIARYTPLGWDGLLIFEFKARLAFLNGGVVPQALLTDPTRTWIHPDYPLLLPLTESWVYSWIGRPDQELIKFIFPLYFAAALGIFFTASRQHLPATWRGLLMPVYLFTVPLIWFESGSASSAYADFPLAVFYLASVVYILEYLRTEPAAALRIAGFLIAAMCWTKQEGKLLCAVLIVFIILRAIQKRSRWREWLRLSVTALPALAIILAWQLFLIGSGIQGARVFLPVNLNTLSSNLWRLSSIAGQVIEEMTNWQRWRLLWLLVFVMPFWFLAKRKYGQAITFLFTVILPVFVYASIYIFSAWDSFLTHLTSSFSRLLMQISLVAVMLVCVEVKDSQKNPGFVKFV